jgi:hypothetical protein
MKMIMRPMYLKNIGKKLVQGFKDTLGYEPCEEKEDD